MPRNSTVESFSPLMIAVLCALAPLAMAAFAHAESAPGSRTDRPIVLVGGMLLDGYEAAPIHDGVPWFDPMGPTVPGVREVGRAH